MRCVRCKREAETNILQPLCRECFCKQYEARVRKLIKKFKLFTPDDRILVAVSGGKDSLSCAQVLHTLGYSISVLHIDVGTPECTNPRTRNVVERFCQDRNIPFFFVSFAEYLNVDPEMLFRRGKRPRCATCGLLKRYVFNRFAREMGFTKLATGHCADDITRYFLKAWVSGNKEHFLWLLKLKPLTPATHPKLVARARPLFLCLEKENYVYTKYNAIVVAGCTMCSFFLRRDPWTEILRNIEEIRPDFALFLARTLARGFPLKEEEVTTPQECVLCGEPTDDTLCTVCKIKARAATATQSKKGKDQISPSLETPLDQSS